MGASVVVVVIVAVGELGTPSSNAMIAATRDALGKDAVVLVEPVQSPSDEKAAGVGLEVNVGAIATVTWPGSDHARVQIHVRLVAEKRWIDRDLTFASNEPLPERGRAAGLTIASIVSASATTPPPLSTPNEVPKTLPTTTDAAPRPTPRIAVAEPLARSSPRLAVDAVVAGTLGIAGPASGLGADLGARLGFPDRVVFRGSVGVRYGTVAAASATSSLLRLAAGAGVPVWQRGDVTVSIQLGVVALRQTLSRATARASTETKSRWLGGADALVDLEWRVAGPVALAVDGGLELALGETRVVVGDDLVATIPRLRAVFAVGLRFRL